MSDKAEFIASGYCDKAVAHRVPRDGIIIHLEAMLGDDVTLLNKGTHHEIWMVYEDSRPSKLIYKLPRGYP